MTEEALQARRDYYKKWRKKNPNKGKEYSARYWAKKAEELSAQADTEPQTTEAK